MSTARLARRGTLGVITGIVLLSAAVLPAQPSHAATVIVRAGQQNGGTAPEREFNAASITIYAGDTVRWEWFDDEHDIVAYDGSYRSPVLDGAGQSYQRAFSVAGTFTYYCDIHAGPGDADPARIDERIADGKMVGKIVVQAQTDTTGPSTSNVAATPNPTGGAASVTLTADISDVGRGGSAIAAAEDFVDSQGAAGTGTAMSATDGGFNSTAEGVTASVNVSGLAPGAHTLFVHGRDSAGNWGPAAVTALSVTAGASLSLTARPVDFGMIKLTGADQLPTASPQPWRASDGRTSGGGWNVTSPLHQRTSLPRAPASPPPTSRYVSRRRRS